MDSLSDVQDISKYLGDASKANWQSSGKPVVYNKNSVLLTMAPETVGTLMASTHYVWYGKVSATMTSSQGAGVVTAFILMSDAKDEIDFEFVGTDTQHVQSNFYFQGITNCKLFFPCIWRHLILISIRWQRWKSVSLEYRIRDPHLHNRLVSRRA
jgi:hypothetical protein